MEPEHSFVWSQKLTTGAQSSYILLLTKLLVEVVALKRERSETDENFTVRSDWSFFVLIKILQVECDSNLIKIS
jgi:hypothetical protein